MQGFSEMVFNRNVGTSCYSPKHMPQIWAKFRDQSSSDCTIFNRGACKAPPDPFLVEMVGDYKFICTPESNLIVQWAN